jgi:hypothetical protein
MAADAGPPLQAAAYGRRAAAYEEPVVYRDRVR